MIRPPTGTHTHVTHQHTISKHDSVPHSQRGPGMAPGSLVLAWSTHHPANNGHHGPCHCAASTSPHDPLRHMDRASHRCHACRLISALLRFALCQRQRVVPRLHSSSCRCSFFSSHPTFPRCLSVPPTPLPNPPAAIERRGRRATTPWPRACAPFFWPPPCVQRPRM